jgi:hypothetical protein
VVELGKRTVEPRRHSRLYSFRVIWNKGPSDDGPDVEAWWAQRLGPLLRLPRGGVDVIQRCSPDIVPVLVHLIRFMFFHNPDPDHAVGFLAVGAALRGGPVWYVVLVVRMRSSPAGMRTYHVTPRATAPVNSGEPS